MTLQDLSSFLNEQIDLFLYEKPFSLNQLQQFLDNRKIIPYIKLNIITFMTQRYKKECEFIKSTLEKQAYTLQLKKDQKESQEPLAMNVNTKEYLQRNAKQQRETRALARIEYQITKQNIDETISEAMQKILHENISRYLNALKKQYKLLESQIDSIFSDIFLTRLEHDISSLVLPEEETELQSELVSLLKKQKEYSTHEVSLHTKKETINLLEAQLSQHQKIINQSQEQKKITHQLTILLHQNRQALDVQLEECSSKLYYLKISTTIVSGLTTLSTIPSLLIVTGVISGLTPLLHICLIALPALFLLTTLAIGLSAFFYFCAIKNNQSLIERNKIHSEANQHALNKNEHLLQLQLKDFLDINMLIKKNEQEHHEMIDILQEKHEDIKCIVAKIEQNTLSPLVFSSLFRFQKESVYLDKQNSNTSQNK